MKGEGRDMGKRVKGGTWVKLRVKGGTWVRMKGEGRDMGKGESEVKRELLVLLQEILSCKKKN